MRLYSKVLLACTAAAFFASAMVVSASARSLMILPSSGPEEDRDVRITWSNLTFDFAGMDVECEVTLSGSFHSKTFTKTSGLLIGQVTSARLNEEGCVGATVDALEEALPWHIRYVSIGGTLPDISTVTIDLIGAALFIDATADCLFGTTAAEPGRGLAILGASGEINSIQADPTRTIDLNGEFYCEIVGNYSFSGVARVDSPDVSDDVILVQLI